MVVHPGHAASNGLENSTPLFRCDVKQSKTETVYTSLSDAIIEKSVSDGETQNMREITLGKTGITNTC